MIFGFGKKKQKTKPSLPHHFFSLNRMINYRTDAGISPAPLNTNFGSSLGGGFIPGDQKMQLATSIFVYYTSGILI